MSWKPEDEEYSVDEIIAEFKNAQLREPEEREAGAPVFDELTPPEEPVPAPIPMPRREKKPQPEPTEEESREEKEQEPEPEEEEEAGTAQEGSKGGAGEKSSSDSTTSAGREPGDRHHQPGGGQGAAGGKEREGLPALGGENPLALRRTQWKSRRKGQKEKASAPGERCSGGGTACTAGKREREAFFLQRPEEKAGGRAGVPGI